MTETTEKLFNLTVPSGKTYQVRSLPKHFFLFAGELPQALTEKAVVAIKSGDMEAFGEDMQSILTPEQLQRMLIFIREAVKHICVNPRISLTPQNETEISPFEISEEDFNFLGKWAMSGAGGDAAEGLNNFRGGSGEAAANSDDGAELRTTSE